MLTRTRSHVRTPRPNDKYISLLIRNARRLVTTKFSCKDSRVVEFYGLTDESKSGFNIH